MFIKDVLIKNKFYRAIEYKILKTICLISLFSGILYT